MYFGRMPVAYVSPSGNSAAGYLVQVRSMPNKKRKFVPKGEDRLWLSPLDPTDLEKPDADLIYYDTMLVMPDRTLFVTNGAQTDKSMKRGKPVLNFEQDFSFRYPSLTASAIMHSWGYEPDSMSTPRVALTVAADGNYCLFSAATKTAPVAQDDIGVASHPFTLFDIFAERRGIGLPTYKLEAGSATSLGLYDEKDLISSLVAVPLECETPEEIAQALFDFSEPDLIVASAGAVLRDGVWQVAYRNRFKSLEEWQEYAAQSEGK